MDQCKSTSLNSRSISLNAYMKTKKRKEGREGGRKERRKEKRGRRREGGKKEEKSVFMPMASG